MLYHVRVRGDLPPSGGLALPDVVVVEVDDDGTVLSCLLPDPAALTATVAYLHDLGLTVLDLRQVDEHEAG